MRESIVFVTERHTIQWYADGSKITNGTGVEVYEPDTLKVWVTPRGRNHHRNHFEITSTLKNVNATALTLSGFSSGKH